jgi:hypothetical protein
MKEFNFKAFKRKTKFTYVLPITEEDIKEFNNSGIIKVKGFSNYRVSISDVDKREHNSPKIGDVIAVNPECLSDQWLIEKSYFEENHEKETSFYGIGSITIEDNN